MFCSCIWRARRRGLQLLYLSWNQTDRWRSKTHHVAVVEFRCTTLWRNPPSPQRINDLNGLWSNPPALLYYPAIWPELAVAAPVRNIASPVFLIPRAMYESVGTRRGPQ